MPTRRSPATSPRRLAASLLAAWLGVSLLGACASAYLGSARATSAHVLDGDGWLAVRDVPFEAQAHESDCGAAAAAMIVAYWTGTATAALAAELRPAPARGLRAASLRDFVQAHGLASFLVHGELSDLAHELASGRPVLVGLAKRERQGAVTHYEIVVGLHEATQRVVTLDPARGWQKLRQRF